MSIEEKLDEILKAVIDGSYTPHWKDDRLVLTAPEAKHQILELIKETLQECIGEEEPEYHDSDCRLGDRCYCVAKTEVHRNQLRQEAYNKLEEKLNQLSQQTLDK